MDLHQIAVFVTTVPYVTRFGKTFRMDCLVKIEFATYFMRTTLELAFVQV